MNKRIAFCLALLLTLQTAVVCVSARSSVPEVYTGTILAAINTDYKDIVQDFTAEPIGTTQAAVTSAQAQAEPEDELLDGALEDDPEPLSYAESKAKEAALGGNMPDAAPKAEYRVGDRKNIHASYHSSFGSDRVDVTCIYTNDYCTVWREDGISKDEQKCIDVAEEFCSVLPREWEVFGDRRVDADGDGKIALFFQNMDSGVGGYFSSNDLVDKYGRIGSVWVAYSGTGNACDCVHLYPGADFNTVLHEYQHYLHCSWKYAGKNNLTCINNNHESYFNEGFSGCAEALLGTHDRSTGFRRAADDPSNFSMVNWSFNGASYTLSYVFCQYMRTRYASLVNDLDSDIPGSGFFREILKTRSEKKVPNTLSIAANLLYPKAQYPELKTADSRCRALIKDFWLAVLKKDESGIHGFNGEAWTKNLVMSISDLPDTQSRCLRSGMASFCRIPSADPFAAANGSARVTNAGKDIVFAAIDNVGKTLILDPQDARFPVRSYITLDNRVSLEYPEDYFASGRSFLGWATAPQSETVRYYFDNTVLLSDARTTLYGVWKDAPALTTLRSASCPKYSNNVLRFTSETDGYYVFTATRGTVNRAEADGETLPKQWEEFSTSAYESVLCYFLQAGQTIDLYFCCDTSRSGTLKVNRVETQFTLCYQYTLDGETTASSIGGNVKYTLRDLDEDVKNRALQNDLGFLGWSDTPDAQTVSYRASDSITLHADTTLYAVFGKLPRLQEGVDTQVLAAETFECHYLGIFTFTPQTSGTYRLTGTADCAEIDIPYLSVLDARQELLRTIWLDPEGNGFTTEVSLQSGKKYRFALDYYVVGPEALSDACTLRLDKIDGASHAQLIYSVPEDSGTLFEPRDFTMKCRYVYTVPDWKLGQGTLHRPVRLIGWSADPDDPDTPVYHARDKIEPITALTLFPVLEPVPQKELNASVSAYLWNNLLALLRYTRIYISDKIL